MEMKKTRKRKMCAVKKFQDARAPCYPVYQALKSSSQLILQTSAQTDATLGARSFFSVVDRRYKDSDRLCALGLTWCHHKTKAADSSETVLEYDTEGQRSSVIRNVLVPVYVDSRIYEVAKDL
ncbi:hypothetical protein ElyMa_004814900 [Elysia marginata]|uniref:Uncharacterized protein n=1 Tax=Elysia marginata TaxID=1093978 RepID=A0AAV4IKG3_9GAST|nr:hypothetical protein ElyMa_004814900 [Elysia marginata]